MLPGRIFRWICTERRVTKEYSYNRDLNAAAVACAERIRVAANRRAGGDRDGDPAARSARWVASDALRELTSDKVRARLNAGEAKG